MKVSTAHEFVPVIVTLESQAEVDLFTSLLGGMHNKIDKAFGLNDEHTYDMFKEIKRFASPGRALLKLELS